MRFWPLFLPCFLFAQSFREVDAIFEKQFQDAKYPGMIYGIVMDGKLVHQKAFGTAKPDTIFRIASMTKSFTVLGILKLRDEGKLSLDDPIVKYIPKARGIKPPTSDSPAITVRHLLTHGAGFPEDNPWGDRQLAISDAELDKWLEKGLPFSTSPGTAYEYSNYGFALLGRIVQVASGKNYKAYMEQEIFQPLGLKSSFLDAKDAPQARLAKGLGYRNGALFEIPSLAHGAFGAMGGLMLDGQDMAKYIAYHLSAWPPRDEAEKGPVKRSSLREMQQLQRQGFFGTGGPRGATSGGYGYGLNISQDCDFAHVVGHGGGLPGFGSYMMWLPEYGVGMYAMANLTYASTAGTIRTALVHLQKEGLIQPRKLPVTPVLSQTREALIELYKKPTAAALDALAADNLYPDLPREMRLAEIEKLRESHGQCSAGPLQPENWLRGRFLMTCDRGRIEASFTLAPTQPPLVQYLRYREVKAEEKWGEAPRCATR